MNLSTLAEWLCYIDQQHKKEIDLGLERVKQVAARLGLLTPSCPVITVGGTNGKGSTVAGLQAIYQTAGYKVGAFTTPFLFKYNEQVRINGNEATEEEFCQVFEMIEGARDKSITLTPFEYSTLAALKIFQDHSLDVMILEVGLGGRLDAVNIIDADVSVITSIGIDHVEWLGNTRESIALEKAGILRPNKIAVCGDIDPPATLLSYAAELKAPLLCRGKHFSHLENETGWSWLCGDLHYQNLPYSNLAIENMATVLMTIRLLQEKLPVTLSDIVSGLNKAALVGRIQVVPGPVTEIYDVSHNPASIAWLARKLTGLAGAAGKTCAVFSMLADKDIAESMLAIKDQIGAWYIAPLNTKRAATPEQLAAACRAAGITAQMFADITKAYAAACAETETGDRIVIFGSFHTVAEILKVNN